MLKKRTKNAFRIATILIAVGVAPSCSNFQTTSEIKKKTATPLPRIDVVNAPLYGDESVAINSMISALKSDLPEKERDALSMQVRSTAEKYDIDPRLLIAIINIESEFNQDKISSTGDVSIAQINVETWNKEFKRIKKTPINKNKIKKDQVYALETMADILCILKKRYEKTDATWYARYHSNNQKYKNEYLHKITKRIHVIASTPILFSNKLAMLR